MTWDEREPWVAPDGTVWLQTGPDEFTGWEPGNDAVHVRHTNTFYQAYPEAPR